MLGKLFKHEWKSISKLLLIVHGFILIFALLSRIFLEINGGINVALSNDRNDIVSLIAALILFFIVLFIFFAAVFTYVYIGYRFYKNVFTEQGYLTNTLPVTPTQIILSKELTGFLWMIIDVFVLIGSLAILFIDTDLLSGLSQEFSTWSISFSSIPIFFWFLLILLLLSPFLMITHLYFCVSIGNLIPNHKVLGAIGTYIISYIIMQIISTAFLGISGFAFSSYIDTTGMSNTEATAFVTNMLNPIFLFSIVFTLIGILFFFFVTRYVMTKKLNLE